MNAAATEEFHHWHIERDAHGTAWLTLDVEGSSVNKLSSDVLREMGEAVEILMHDRPRGLILCSGKDTGFIAGADVTEFVDIRDPDEVAEQLSQVHALFARIETAPFPVVAQIDGFCLGGGLELALACRYRVASDDPSTRLGFPEVMLGIHPGFGGTMRSIRHAGAPAAFDLMLTGRGVNAKKAAGLGLVDKVVPRRHLGRAALSLLKRDPGAHRAAWYLKAANSTPARRALAAVLRRQVAKRARREHYPAPWAMIDLYEEHGGDEQALLKAERESIAKLFVTPASRNLVRLFLLQERIKGLGKSSDFEATHVHVIGAGTMGGDIAAWCAYKGMTVTLQDREARFIAPAMARAQKFFARRLRDKRLRTAAMDRLMPDVSGLGVRRADVVIEAIVEDLGAKQALFTELQDRLKDDAVLATNTSSIPLEDIATCLNDPERLVGIHFFNPVTKMQLVEIIAGSASRSEEIDKATAFVIAIDRLPLPVTSSPGFLINRILSPYMLEAIYLMEEGVAPDQIDKAIRQFGMPMGPVELADTVGLDICLAVGEVLAEKFGGEVPALLRRRVEQGRLGVKSGRGFYQYRDGKPERDGVEPDAGKIKDIQDRLVLTLANESVACLREGVVADADLLDAGLVFGTGFAPFRGGPMQYLRDRGPAVAREALEGLQARHGDRFTPDEAWTALLETGTEPETEEDAGAA
ncbi:MAG: enoyl-CoA hydratase/isomerase family protein [Gammaproteobacteria bacterium]|nr:enoyl-CoA hydratase/isomerase family protein [Gammaproteobacteria bacterium]